SITPLTAAKMLLQAEAEAVGITTAPRYGAVLSDREGRAGNLPPYSIMNWGKWRSKGSNISGNFFTYRSSADPARPGRRPGMCADRVVRRQRPGRRRPYKSLPDYADCV